MNGGVVHLRGFRMAAPTDGAGADMKQAAHTYGVFLNMLKLLIALSILALLILIVVYNV